MGKLFARLIRLPSETQIQGHQRLAKVLDYNGSVAEANQRLVTYSRLADADLCSNQIKLDKGTIEYVRGSYGFSL